MCSTEKIEEVLKVIVKEIIEFANNNELKLGDIVAFISEESLHEDKFDFSRDSIECRYGYKDTLDYREEELKYENILSFRDKIHDNYNIFIYFDFGVYEEEDSCISGYGLHICKKIELEDCDKK